MSADSLLRIAALCVVLACAETLHGIARTLLVIPRIGKDRALKLSALTGSVLAFVICYLLVPPIGLQGVLQNLVLGLVLAAFMASFDISLGVFLLRKPWSKIAPDFDPRTGNYLVFGLAFLVMVPALVAVLRSSP